MYSQPQVAELIGVKWNTFKDWLRLGTLPRVDQAQHLADLLETTIDYLSTGRTNEPVDDPNITIILEKLRGLSDLDLGFAMGQLSQLESNPMRPKPVYRERAGESA